MAWFTLYTVCPAYFVSPAVSCLRFLKTVALSGGSSGWVALPGTKHQNFESEEQLKICVELLWRKCGFVVDSCGYSWPSPLHPFTGLAWASKLSSDASPCVSFSRGPGVRDTHLCHQLKEAECESFLVSQVPVTDQCRAMLPGPWKPESSREGCSSRRSCLRAGAAFHLSK